MHGELCIGIGSEQDAWAIKAARIPTVAAISATVAAGRVRADPLVFYRPLQAMRKTVKMPGDCQVPQFLDAYACFGGVAAETDRPR